MATELSFSQAFDRLVTILNGSRLGWVVAQVEDEIRLGKPVTRRVKELKLAQYPVDPTTRFRRYDALEPGREVQFRATVAYTDAERLKLLLSAIHQIIIGTATIAKVTTQHFPGLVFVSEEDDHVFVVKDLEQEDRMRAVIRLQQAIDQLNSQLG
jgi:hypothetical protein